MNSPPTDRFGLSPKAFSTAFPFHLVIDHDMNLLQVGPGTRGLLPGLSVGDSVSHHFRIQHPEVPLTFEAIQNHTRSVFLLDAISVEGLVLKGQMVPIEEEHVIVFLGSPWVTTVKDVAQLGLSLKDFAVHDSISDYLFLIQTQTTSLADASRLSGELKELNRKLEYRVEKRTWELSSANEELHAQADELAKANELLNVELSARKRAEEEVRILNQDLEQRVVERTGELVLSEEELRQANAGLCKEIDDRRRVEEKLKFLATELVRSNKELQDFASVAAHDLQEPLRKVRVFGDRLKAKCGEALGERGRDYLTRMQSATERMQNLIIDLLALSRVTTRARPFVSINLGEVVRRVLSDLEVRVEQTGGRVEVGELPSLEADPTQIRQLLQNLIGNALKFHRKDVPPLVKVHAEHLNGNGTGLAADSNGNGKYCRIMVEDNGIGFDEKYLGLIFTVFQRLHGRSEYEGTGVGLAICRKIAERHGGSITAKSTLGEGASFLITLPLQQARKDGTV